MAITPSQAVPLFFQKFEKLVTFFRGKFVGSTSLSKTQQYILVRDSTFFVLDFFTGDRASDLGRLLSNNVYKLKDREGFLLKFTLTKNLRKGAPRLVALVRFGSPELCPVAWIQFYIDACKSLSVRLGEGYFFRATGRDNSISPRPFTGSAVNNRLKKHLSEANLNAGETPHSFRVGLSNTLRLLGGSQEEVAQYLGWKGGDIAKRYMQVLDADVGLSLLGNTFSREGSLSATPFSHPDNLQSIV